MSLATADMSCVVLTSKIECVAPAVRRDLGLPHGVATAYIITASEKSPDMSWRHASRAALVAAGFALQDYTVTDKSAAELKSDLAAFPVLLVEGGDPFYLLARLHTAGTRSVFAEIARSKLYIGNSAGATLAGPDIYPARSAPAEVFPDLPDTTGLGLVDVVVLSHWGSEFGRMKFLEGGHGGRGRIFHNFDDSFRRIFLCDNQYLLWRDGTFAFSEYPPAGAENKENGERACFYFCR